MSTDILAADGMDDLLEPDNWFSQPFRKIGRKLAADSIKLSKFKKFSLRTHVANGVEVINFSMISKIDEDRVMIERRHYDPATGRWTSKDSLLFSGGETSPYIYVVNDPINFIDPAGSSATTVGGVIGGAISGAILGGGLRW